MTDKQYKVAKEGIIEQIKFAQSLHCNITVRKLKESLEKLDKKYLKPSRVSLISEGNNNTTTHYE